MLSRGQPSRLARTMVALCLAGPALSLAAGKNPDKFERGRGRRAPCLFNPRERQTLRGAGLFSARMQCGRRASLDLRPIMLDTLRNFVAELAGHEQPQARFGHNDYRLAAAAMLIHAAMIDGTMD